MRVVAGVPPSGVTVIIPVPRLGVAGASTAFEALVAGRKLPDHFDTFPPPPPVAPTAAPLVAHPANPIRHPTTRSRTIITMLAVGDGKKIRC
jgi:hypothetical protein